MIPESSAVRGKLHLLRRSNARFSVASIAGLLACASMASAADEAHSQRPAQRQGLSADTDHRPSPFTVFDTNHDGALSAEEIAAASAMLRQQDRNGDGKLTGDEMHPHPPRRPRDAGGDDELPPPPAENDRP